MGHGAIVEIVISIAYPQVGALSEMIEHGRDGYLVKRDDRMVANMCRHIAHLVDDDKHHKKISRAARNKVERQLTNRIFETKYRELIEECVG